MKKIYTARSPFDAHLLKGALEGEQIEAIVQGDFLWGARGEVPITPETCPSVWIVNIEITSCSSIIARRLRRKRE
jgi:hypothetical protein